MVSAIGILVKWATTSAICSTAHRTWSHSGAATQGHPVEDTSTWPLEPPWVACRESERTL
jgi:hypothetical protein